LHLEALEARTLLSNIVWTNEGNSNNDSDLFNATYGANAAVARSIVETAINRWATIIQNFNYNHVGQQGYAPVANTFSLSIFAGNLGGGGRGSTGNIIVDPDGKPFAANIAMDDNGGGPGWFFDTTPGDSGEFTTLLNRYAASFSGTSNDFERSITHEIGHAVGLVFGGTQAINKYFTFAGFDQSSASNGGGSQLYQFSAGSTTATFTTYNGGHIYEGPADPNFPTEPVSPNELMNDGRTVGAPPTLRELPSVLDASILRDAYGYTIEPIANIDSFLTTLENGVLTVHNDPQVANETITVDTTRVLGLNLITVTVDGITSGWFANSVNSINVTPGTGSNTINIRRDYGGILITVASQGSDTVNIGHDRTVQDIQGDISIFNTSFTTVNMDDSADAGGHAVTITNGWVSGLAPANIFYSQVDVNAVNITGSRGGSTYNVISTPFFATTSLINEGPDTVNVGNAGSLAGILGNLSISNPPDFTTVNVNDSADTAGHTVTVTSASIAGLARGVISYAQNDLRALNIAGSKGGSTYYVLSTPFSQALVALQHLFLVTSISGRGPDTVNVGNAGSLAGIVGDLVVSDPPDFTTLNVDDSADTAGHTVTVTNGGITGLAPGTISYTQNDLAAVNITGSQGGSTYNVLSTPFSQDLNDLQRMDLVTSISGRGPDTVNVGNAGSLAGIVGDLVVSDPPDFTTLNVDDSADTAGHTVTVTNGGITGLAPGFIGYTQNDLRALNITGSKGGSSYYVLSAPFSQDLNDLQRMDLVTSISGRGPDTVNVDNAGSLAGIVGDLVISNPPDFTTLNVDDSADTAGHTVTVTNAGISGLAPGFIGYTQNDLAALNITGSQGGSTYDVLSTPYSQDLVDTQRRFLVTSINGQGQDMAHVGDANGMQDIRGDLSFENETGLFTLTFDDSADMTARNPTMDTFTPAGEVDPFGLITGLAPGDVTYELVDTALPVTTLTGNGGNVINVRALGAPGMDLNNGGNDVVNVGNAVHGVQDILGSLALVNPSALVALSVDDSADLVAQFATISSAGVSGLATGSIFTSPGSLSSIIIVGGAGGNRFDILSTQAVPMSLNSGAGNDVVNVQALSGPLSLDGGGGLDGFTFGDPANLNGPITFTDTGGLIALTEDDSADNIGRTVTITDSAITGLGVDPINYDASQLSSLSVLGGSGGNTFIVQSTAALPLNLNTGSGNDIVTMGDGAVVSGVIDGGGGFDTLDYSAYTTGVTVNLLAGTATGTGGVTNVHNVTGSPFNDTLTGDDAGDVLSGNGGQDVLAGGTGNDTFIVGATQAQGTTVSGGGGTDTLVAPDTSNIWNLTATNAGNVGNVTFTSVQNLTGGMGSETFVFGNGAGVTGVIDGGGGFDTLDYSAYTTGVTVNLLAGTATGTGGLANVHNVTGGPANDTITGDNADDVLSGNGGKDALVGGTGNDTFLLGVTQALGTTVTGGGGSDTLVGANLTNAWTLTGAGAGNLNSKVTFTGIANLLGGSANDTFKFKPGGSVAGTVDGSGGTANKLDYSALAGPIAVNLQSGAATFTGGFSNIQSLAGSKSAADTLIGPDTDTTWTVSAVNGGKAGTFAFTGIENLVGGAGVDVFKFTGTGSVAGGINGGGSPAGQGDWLDYSAVTYAVTVNLATGAASHVTGGVSGIQNVHGGNHGNTLTGSALGNVLIGGTGADTITGGSGASILIGDKGADHITGGSGSDILIGDYTTYDTMSAANEKALMSILAEWQSADSYAVRFHDINTGTGGGLNGAAKLNFTKTVKDDGSADTVTAAASAQALDWFFQGLGDTLVNKETGEHVNNT
jgi:hypothetical protein